MGLSGQHYAATMTKRIVDRMPSAVMQEMKLRAQKLGCPLDVEPKIRETMFGVEYRFDW